MGDRFYVNYDLFYFFGVRISRVGFADQNITKLAILIMPISVLTLIGQVHS